MTIEEIGEILMSDMNDRFVKKEQFRYLKELITPSSNNNNLKMFIPPDSTSCD